MSEQELLRLYQKCEEAKNSNFSNSNFAKDLFFESKRWTKLQTLQNAFKRYF